MPYAILQRELAVISAGQLIRAFKVLPALTDLDAQTKAHGAFGILIKGLDVIDASALQDALLAEEVQTEVVEETELPIIPPAKLVKQIDLLPMHLSMYDPMGRAFSVPWQEIGLLAAGAVRLEESRKARSAEDLHHFGAASGVETAAEPRPQGPQLHWLLEIVLRGSAGRYSIKADDFIFNHLAERLTADRGVNFRLLVQDLAQYAPHAGLNRGACLLVENLAEVFTYPSKATFFEELTWVLWRIAQMR